MEDLSKEDLSKSPGDDMRHINGCIRRLRNKPMRRCRQVLRWAAAFESDGGLRELDMRHGKQLISAGWSVRTGQPIGVPAAVTNAHHARVF